MFKKGFQAVHSGFTLAEVLITLGIIGVVAAMTMPTLLNSTNGAQYKTAYKKALSVISQAIVLNLALDDYDLGTTTSTDTTGTSIFALLNNRMNVVRTETGSIEGYSVLIGDSATAVGSAAATTTPIADTNYTVFFNDGIMFTFKKAAINCTEANTIGETAAAPSSNNCYGFIDVNGTKAPNRETTCSNDPEDDDDCIVDNPSDIYPVVFYDQGIYPATAAGKAVLYKK